MNGLELGLRFEGFDCCCCGGGGNEGYKERVCWV
jgi:hypothetical protein